MEGDNETQRLFDNTENISHELQSVSRNPYRCNKCFELAARPVVTECGHIFWYSFNYTAGPACPI